MTAVEFIRQEFLEKITNENYNKSFDEIIEQAKEMESKQSYSEEDVLRLLVKRELFLELYDMSNEYEDANEWFKKFKK